MDHRALMREIHRLRQKANHPRRRRRRLRLALETLIERSASNVLHHDIGQPLRLSNRVNLDDVGMIEPSRRLRFAAQTGRQILGPSGVPE